MGLDLRLLPVEHDGGDWGYSHSVLSCHSGRDIYEAVKAMPATPVPAQFHTFVARLENGECGYGNTQETPYGERVECLTVQQLLTLPERVTQWDRAAWAYLAALPPSTRIALFWH